MIKPRALKQGDTIGIVGPASPTPLERIKPSIEKVKDLGFNVIVGDSCYGLHGYLSGRDELRAKDINEMFKNKTINGIWCIRGGYGTPRILDMIDYETIRMNPKVFIGYSDITALHIAINQMSDLVTFHGPMVSTELFYDIEIFTKDYLFKNIMKPEPLGMVKNPKNVEIEILLPGKCEGGLIGGNLSLLAATIGTPYEIDTKGKILFIEDIDEELYKIDRMLTQLRLSGKLNDAKGFVLGNWNNCVAKEPEKSLTLMEIFEEILVPIGKPTIYNVMIGHCEPMITLPLGVNSILDAENKALIIDESATYI